VARWHEQIGDPTMADGILDRLVHNAHRIEMRGDSMRKTFRASLASIRSEGDGRKYVDAIVKRWQEYTDKSAAVEGDGGSFQEIARVRSGNPES
jgi:hypothetical protein